MKYGIKGSVINKLDLLNHIHFLRYNFLFKNQKLFKHFYFKVVQEHNIITIQIIHSSKS